MTFTPSIRGFIPGGSTYNMCCVDWENARVYVSDLEGGTTWYMNVYDLNTGAVLGRADMSALVPGCDIENFAVDAFGACYFPIAVSNFTGFAQVNSDLTLRGTWGATSAFDNIPLGLPYSSEGFSAVRAGNQIYVLEGSKTSGFWVGVMAGTPFGYFATYNPAQSNPSTCPGAQGADYAEAWVLCQGDGGMASDMNLYKWRQDSTGDALTLLIDIAATDIDATWTTCNHEGLAFDETDGNLICKFTTVDAGPTNKKYIAKVDSGTGAIRWLVPVQSQDASPLQTARGRIRYGKFAYFDYAQSAVVEINTITGDSVLHTGNLAGIFGFTQCFDDSTGAIIINCTFGVVADGPTVLPDSPTSFTGWAALFAIEVTHPPAPNTTIGYTRIWGFP